MAETTKRDEVQYRLGFAAALERIQSLDGAFESVLSKEGRSVITALIDETNATIKAILPEAAREEEENDPSERIAFFEMQYKFLQVEHGRNLKNLTTLIHLLDNFAFVLQSNRSDAAKLRHIKRLLRQVGVK